MTSSSIENHGICGRIGGVRRGEIVPLDLKSQESINYLFE